VRSLVLGTLASSRQSFFASPTFNHTPWSSPQILIGFNPNMSQKDTVSIGGPHETKQSPSLQPERASRLSMGLNSVRPFQSSPDAALLRDMAEVPKSLVEDFARDLFRMAPESRVFPSQLEFAINEINSGKEDFLGWLLEAHPDKTPESQIAMQDFLQRTERQAIIEKIQDQLADPEVSAEIPISIIEDFAREVHGLQPADDVDDDLLSATVSGIADGSLPFLDWIEKFELGDLFEQVG
jgi:hypothetical protein